MIINLLRLTDRPVCKCKNKKSKFMKKSIFFIMLIGLCQTLFAKDRPNVVIIIADDLGYADMSFGEI